MADSKASLHFPCAPVRTSAAMVDWKASLHSSLDSSIAMADTTASLQSFLGSSDAMADSKAPLQSFLGSSETMTDFMATLSWAPVSICYSVAMADFKASVQDSFFSIVATADSRAALHSFLGSLRPWLTFRLLCALTWAEVALWLTQRLQSTLPWASVTPWLTLMLQSIFLGLRWCDGGL